MPAGELEEDGADVRLLPVDGREAECIAVPGKRCHYIVAGFHGEDGLSFELLQKIPKRASAGDP